MPQDRIQLDRRAWPWAGGVLAAAILPFLPALWNGFVNWDDPRFIVDNPHIRGLSAAHLVAMFSRFVDGNYIPLTQLSFAFNHAVHGLWPAGFHATNLLLHAANAGLVWLLLMRLGGTSASAAVGAIAFALHPLRVESVAWATERKDVLFSLFYLLALHAYTRYLADRAWRRLARVLLWFVLSGLSKQMAISLPVVLLLLDWAAGRKWTARAVCEKIPFVLVALAFVAVAYAGQHTSGALVRGTQFTPLHRLLLSCNSLVMYGRGIVWPVELSCIHPYPRDVVAEAAYTPFVVLAVAGAAVYFGYRFRPLWVGGLFFLATLAPVLNVAPAGSQMVADRFTYLPSVGLSYLLAVSCAGGWARWSRRRRQLALAAGTAALLVLPVLTWKRVQVWKDDLTLWTDTVRKAPDAFVAQSNLALAHFHAGAFEEAAAGFSRAIRISPAVADSYHNRGRAYQRLGRREPALADLTTALALEPGQAALWHSRAELHFESGECAKALPDYARAIELAPDFLDARMGRGICLGMEGSYDAAIAEFSAVLERDPGLLDARYNRGKALYETRRLDDAIAEFTEILLRDPSYAKALYHRAVALLDTGRAEEAARDLAGIRQLGYEAPADLLRRLPAERE